MTSDSLVYVSIDGTDVLAGRLYSHRRRGSESASFSYDDRYLARARAYALDPQLPLVAGIQQTELDLALFHAFADSSPDRWGRNLLLRRERLLADQEHRTTRSLGELDLLLGVRDDLRQGALRFRTAPDRQFLATEEAGIPLLTDLSSLLAAADRVDTDAASGADLALLVRAGSSLGGARPKAHVLDPVSGRISIAKFPSPQSDRWDVMAWEQTALDLARRAGVVVPESRLVEVGGRSVLIVGRFDRVGNRRIGYASALTMLEAHDGEIGSYLDIAAVIEERSADATSELAQLWRRVALSILISNTDDHLRNHGFLHEVGDVWRLSPAFDLNPNPDPGPKHLATAIDDAQTAALIDTLLSVAGLFRLDRQHALAVLGEVAGACAEWMAVATRNGVARSGLAIMAPAFEHSQAQRARELLRD